MVRSKTNQSMIHRSVENEPDAPRRRFFLSLAWIFLGMVALVEFLWLAVRFIAASNQNGPRPSDTLLVKAGAVADIATGSVTAFVRGKFYLCRLADGGFLALSRQCTHLGCTVPWDDAQQRFVCPCHSSVFDIRGEVLRHPAPRALDLHPLSIVNDEVWVDVSRRIRRDRYQPDQVVYPQKV